MYTIFGTADVPFPVAATAIAAAGPTFAAFAARAAIATIAVSDNFVYLALLGTIAAFAHSQC